MSSKTKSLNPMLRWWAGLVLTVWLSACGYCSAMPLLHCEPADDHADSHAHTDIATVQHEHSEEHSAGNDSNGSESNGCHGDSFCDSLGNLVLPSTSIALIKADPGQLAFAVLTCEHVESQSQLSALRQPPERILVFTPGVSLDPTNQNHAPPFFS